MVLFLIVGVVTVIGLVFAIEWLLDRLSRASDEAYLASGAGQPPSQAEQRALAQAD